MKAGNEISTNPIQFTSRFFQAPITAHEEQASESAVSVSYTPEKYGRWENFQAHPDYAIAQQQYRQLFDNINTFVAQHCLDSAPIQAAFTNFLLRLEEGEFISRMPLLYGVGKSTFEAFYRLLMHENLALDRKTAALTNLATEVDACADGAINSLIVLVRQLQCTLMGNLGEALRIKEQMIEQLMREFTAARSSNRGMEKHHVAVYLNALREEYGLPSLESDIHAHQDSLGITSNDLVECLYYVRARLTPEHIVSVMADNYLAEIQSVLPLPEQEAVEEKSPVSPDRTRAEKTTAEEEAEAVYVPSENALRPAAEREEGVSYEELNTRLQALKLKLTPIYGDIPDTFLFQEIDNRYYAPNRNTLIRLGLMHTLQRSGVCEAEETLFSQYNEPDIVIPERIPDPGGSGKLIETGKQRIMRGPTTGIYHIGVIWWACPQGDNPTLLTLSHLQHLTEESDLPLGMLEEAIRNSSAEELAAALPHWIPNPAFFKPYASFIFRGREDQLTHIISTLFRQDLSSEETCRIALSDAFEQMGAKMSETDWQGISAQELFCLLFQMKTDHAGHQQTLLTQVNAERNEQILKNLLLAGMPPETRDANGYTPLIHAARGGWLDTIDQLSQMDIDIDATNSLGTTALMIAAACGHVAVIEKLFTLGANASLTNISGRNALMYAIMAGRKDVIEYLLTARQAHARQERFSLDAWLHTTQPHTWFDINAADVDGRTALAWLFHSETPAQTPETTQHILRLLLRHGADVNIRPRNTILPGLVGNHEENLLEHTKVFTTGCLGLLLDAGIRLSVRDERMCQSILGEVVRHGTLTDLQRLIQLKLPTYYQPRGGEFSLIEQAIIHEDPDTALLLLSRHQAELSYETRVNLLFRLVETEDISSDQLKQMFDLLLNPTYLRRPAPVPHIYYSTFLDAYLYYLNRGDEHSDQKGTASKTCRILRQYNVAHLPLHNGDTLLMHLVKTISDYREYDNDRHIASMLRELAQDTDLLLTKDRSGLTPFAIACLSADIQTMEMLYQANPAVINIRDTKNNTPLMLAANSRQLEVINWLLEREPDLHATNDDGYTALRLARMRGHQAGIKALRNAGADTKPIAEAISQ